jgi:fimbrial chaperone protein
MISFSSLKTRSAAAVAATVLAIAATPALALLVQPILIKLNTSGSGSSAAIEVVNDRNRPVTVEIGVEQLLIPERGPATRAPDAGDEFQIFPPQAVVPAGGRQIFRVRWVGEPTLDKGKLFMFSTAELPVQLDEGRTGVSIYYAVESVVAVSPTGARPEISVAKVERAVNASGVAGLEVTFVNDGAAIGYANDASLRLSIPGSDWSMTLNSSELNNAFGLGILPAAQTRVMFFAPAGVPAEGEIVAQFTPQPRR